ncbi:hypothetical protein BPA30113_06102 [Burkholderia paludis]|uniref:Uncharacterized protein n=1 Tax=Burkholderia paludis TaxID=1506587 RepID=A0A6P2R6I3_9BURK|nr:hypothetical protein LMG30113_06530 [Burkholderia paludis]VWC27757.1 hypothetical protein BPA30113_06102 [Burkholderia paludis]
MLKRGQADGRHLKPMARSRDFAFFVPKSCDTPRQHDGADCFLLIFESDLNVVACAHECIHGSGYVQVCIGPSFVRPVSSVQSGLSVLLAIRFGVGELIDMRARRDKAVSNADDSIFSQLAHYLPHLNGCQVQRSAKFRNGPLTSVRHEIGNARSHRKLFVNLEHHNTSLSFFATHLKTCSPTLLDHAFTGASERNRTLVTSVGGFLFTLDPNRRSSREFLHDLA